MLFVIGKGGLEERTATQAIHAIYDMQEAVEFGVWKRHWGMAAEKLKINQGDDLFRVKKIAAPILTRWWTVGEAAKDILEYFPILIEMTETFRNVNTSHTRMNKIASGVISLMREPEIVSDIKLISCFHAVFLNSHFAWLQKGDKEIGGTPGYLGRHMLVRYFLMFSDLKKLTNGGWRQEGGEKMEPFLKSLEDEAMNKQVPDPGDPEKVRMTLGKNIQAEKADMFFQTSLTILQKHFDPFCERLLFLSLYGEQCSTQTVAKVLLSHPNFSIGERKIKSKFHGGRDIDVDKFSSFVKEKVNIDEQNDNFHVRKVRTNEMELLAGK